MNSVTEIISLWPSYTALACDLTLKMNGAKTISRSLVRGWKRDGCSIPAIYHLSLVSCAEDRGIALTLEDIARVCDSRSCGNKAI